MSTPAGVQGKALRKPRRLLDGPDTGDAVFADGDDARGVWVVGEMEDAVGMGQRLEDDGARLCRVDHAQRKVIADGGQP